MAGVAAAALVGCGGTAGTGSAGSGPAATGSAGSRSAEPPTASPALPARTGGALTSPPAAQGGNAGVLPAGFPLPPGTTVGPVALSGGDITTTLTITAGKSGYDFWRTRLPAAGYTVAKAEMVGGIGEITFAGHGCAAGSQLGISDRDVAFQCRRG